MFTQAITRTPSTTLASGLTGADLGAPDISRALDQHRLYRETLGKLGVRVTLLDANDAFPDSVFVEDVAICLPGCAVITRPGASSRRDETALIEASINQHFATVKRIEAPGTLDGGDVMIADRRVFVGLSARTNKEGASQLMDIVSALGYTGIPVSGNSALHLKTGISYLEQNNLLVWEEFDGNPVFEDFNRIRVDADEAYAANSLWINGTVLVPGGHDQTRQRIEAAGYDTIALEMSEFRKLDGGLSCLSLRF